MTKTKRKELRLDKNIEKIFTNKAKELGDIDFTRYVTIGGLLLASMEKDEIDIFLPEKYMIKFTRSER